MCICSRKLVNTLLVVYECVKHWNESFSKVEFCAFSVYWLCFECAWSWLVFVNFEIILGWLVVYIFLVELFYFVVCFIITIFIIIYLWMIQIRYLVFQSFSWLDRFVVVLIGLFWNGPGCSRMYLIDLGRRCRQPLANCFYCASEKQSNIIIF